MPTTALDRKNIHIQKYERIDRELADLNSEGKSPIYIQQAKLSRALAYFQILRQGANTSEAAELSTDICKTAKKYGLMKYCIEPSEFLFRYYSQYKFNRTKALKMKMLNIESNHVFGLEQIANRSYSDLILIQRSKQSKHLLLDKSLEFWRELKPHLGKINSFEFHKISFMIGLTYFRALADWKSTELLSKQAIKYFESLALKSNPILSVYYRQLINAKLIQGKEQGTQKLLATYKSLIRKNTANWFLFQYTLARIKLIKNEYTDARNILLSTSQTRGFKSISKVNKLAIDLASAYNEYALNFQNKEINIPLSLLKAKEEDMFSEQYKLQLLIIRLIYFCHHKEWKLVETNSAAISKFLSRKLIRKDQGRSYNFINMLLQLSERQYHHIAIKRHTNRFHNKLLAQPCKAIGSEQDYEIIPYERLWEMIMENLKK